MERAERWRQLLAHVRDTYCDGNQADLARRIEKDPNYVNRLFWPPDKKGAKGIGPEITEACTKKFGLPMGFWELDPRDDSLRSSPFEPTGPRASAPRALSVEDALKVLAFACSGVSPEVRTNVLDLLALVIKDPTAHAKDQIPVIARKLLGEPPTKTGTVG